MSTAYEGMLATAVASDEAMQQCLSLSCACGGFKHKGNGPFVEWNRLAYPACWRVEEEETKGLYRDHSLILSI